MKKATLIISTSILLAIGLTGCAESSNKTTPTQSESSSPMTSPTGSASPAPLSPVGPVAPSQPEPSGTLITTPQAAAPTPPSKSEQVTAKAVADKTVADELTALAKAAEERLAKVPVGSADAARAAEEAQSLNQSAEKARATAEKSAAEATKVK